MKQSAVVNPASMQGYYDVFHFAAAARSADLLLCSGQLGTGQDGAVLDDPEAQFVAAFEHVGTVLAEAGLDFDDVLEITTFHIGLRDHLATFVRVKDRFMPAPYSAWTAIGVSQLALPGALVEIRATAQLRAQATRARPAARKPRPAKKTAATRKRAARKKVAAKRATPSRKKRAASRTKTAVSGTKTAVSRTKTAASARKRASSRKRARQR
jgi:enamine deaminase RidA (YjgF/YER057c/UK114 family)